jgi:hypothetical protein
MAELRESGARSRGLTVRISEQPGSGRPIQPEGASTPLDEVRPTMLENLAVSSVRPDYRRQLEMDTQDSEEDFFFPGAGDTLVGAPELFPALVEGMSAHPDPSPASGEARRSHLDPAAAAEPI